MKAQTTSSFIMLFSMVICLTLENFAQTTERPTIVPVDKSFKDQGLRKMKGNMRRDQRAGSVVQVSVRELRALMDRAAATNDTLIFFSVVGMEPQERRIWSLMNPTMDPNDYNNTPTIIFKFGKGDPPTPTRQQAPAFANPLMMIFHPVFTVPYQTDYFALGALCPPPRNCDDY